MMDGWMDDLNVFRPVENLSLILKVTIADEKLYIFSYA
jgi:hypothetical protein